mgnify:CR=1 FL=1
MGGDGIAKIGGIEGAIYIFADSAQTKIAGGDSAIVGAKVADRDILLSPLLKKGTFHSLRLGSSANGKLTTRC